MGTQRVDPPESAGGEGMNYGSVCSGVEAATAAWHPLGWEPQWFSEIEKFPSAVLEHHYPNVQNLGDMTQFKEWPNDPIDLLVGGTPCQSFSVAGLRKGLDDPRGNLMLTYLAIAERYQPRWLVWENVPGVLSSNRGRDFGTFLAALGKIGYGFAYRVLDAQYYGVAQRRRRVFVVGYLGDWRRAAAVLFERESLSGHPAPSREAGQKAAGYTATSFGKYSEGVGTVKAAGGDLGGGSETLHVTTGSLCARTGLSMSVQDAQQGHLLPIAFGAQNSASQGDSVSTEVTPTLDKSKTPAVAWSIMPMNSGKDYKARITDVAQPIMAGGPVGGNQGGDFIQQTVGTLTRASSAGGTVTQQDINAGHIPLTPAVVTGWSEELNALQDLQPTIQRGGAGGRHEGVMQPDMQVRRLTPTECERLQGFPDDYTQIPWRNKAAGGCPDGPRYKAMGNSMAVPVMRWIGERIQMVEEM
jgi:DNA (cytosine-5)-methyltransferase 1